MPAYDIPYKPAGQTCGRGPADLELRLTKISGFITQRSRASMQDAIQTRGPIIAVLRAYQDLKNYKGGVYRYDGKSPFLYNQTVSVIGFTPDGWLCKNSWGPNWGTAGCFVIAYGECGIDDEWMWEFSGFTKTYPYGTVAGTERHLDAVLVDLDVESVFQKAMDGLQRCVALHGGDLVDGWRRRLADYPDAVAALKHGA